jgi:hypothetical protein
VQDGSERKSVDIFEISRLVSFHWTLRKESLAFVMHALDFWTESTWIIIQVAKYIQMLNQDRSQAENFYESQSISSVHQWPIEITLFPLFKPSLKCLVADMRPCTDIFDFPSISVRNTEYGLTVIFYDNYGRYEASQTYILWSLFSFSKAENCLFPLRFWQIALHFQMFIAPFESLKWFLDSRRFCTT